MNRNSKLLAFSLMSILLLSSCSASLQDEITYEARSAPEIKDKATQEEMLNDISQLSIVGSSNGKYAISVSIEFSASFLSVGTGGYLYYDFNRQTEDISIDLKLNGVTNVDLMLVNDNLNAKVNMLGFNLYDAQDQSVAFPRKNLYELIDFSLIKDVDRNYITKFRRSRTYIEALNYRTKYLYIIDVDGNYINEMINLPQFKFLANPEVILVIDAALTTLEAVVIKGNVRVNNAINTGVEILAYIVP